MKRRSPLLLVIGLLLPGLALLFVFNYLPAFIGLSRAFTHWETGEPPRFSGFENFTRMAQDEFLRISVVNQALLLLLNLVKTLTMPFLVAELLIGIRSLRWQYMLRTAFILPMVVPGMVTMLLWAFIYDGSIGILNQLLELFHFGGLTRSWLGESSTALFAVAGVGFPWAGGLALLIYLAGLTAIPTDVWDSCALDGATGWRRVWAVDLPLLRPQVSLLATLVIIGTLQDFGSILVLTAGGPGLATHVPALHMYFQAFRFGHLGYASTIGLALFLIILALSALNHRWGRRLDSGV
jgi:ABC-type sugar transport system permease subunit